MENENTLGSKLPPEEAAGLSQKVKDLTKDEIHALHTGENKHPVDDSKLTQTEYDELRGLAITRVNKGESPFPWSDMNFHKGNTNDKAFW